MGIVLSLRQRRGAAAMLLASSALPLLPGAVLAQAIPLEEIVVSANRTPTAAARTGASVAAVDAATLAAGGGRTVGDVLARLPGFHFSQTGGPGQTSGFALRGVPQTYVRVLVDGIEVSDPSAPPPAASLSGLPAWTFDRVEVLKGSQSALYGGQAVAGVISLETAPPTREGWSGEVEAEAGSFGTVGGAYSFGYAGAAADVTVNVEALHTDGFSAADEAAGNTEEDGYDRQRVSFSGNLYPSDTLRLFGSGFWQDEEGEYDASFPPPTFQVADSEDAFAVDTRGLRAGAELALGATTQTFAASWFDIERRFFTPEGALNFSGDGERLVAEYLGEAAPSPALGLLWGLDHRREEAVFNGEAVDLTLTGAFAQASVVRGGLTLSAALRHDEHSDFGGATTGRLTAAYVLPSDTILRASVGTGFRPPSLDELFGPFGANPDLEPEESLSYDVGIEQAFLAGRARASATLYRIEIDDLITFDTACAAAPFGCYDQVLEGEAVSQGVEVAASFAVREAVTLAANYTYTDAEQPLAGGGTVRRSRVPRHDLTLALDAETGPWGFGVAVRRVEDAVESGVALDDYTLVNARAAYALATDAELSLRAENLLDEEYQTARGYGTAGASVFLGLAARF